MMLGMYMIGMFHVVDNLSTMFGMLCDDYFLQSVAVTSFGFHFVMLYDAEYVLIYECYKTAFFY